MNHEVKEKWLKALRSGEYKQATGMLCRISCVTQECSYCCLGVLTDMYLKEHGKEWEIRDGYKACGYNSSWLPLEVAKWAELDEINPKVGTGKLAWYNDDGKTFEELATMIEEQL